MATSTTAETADKIINDQSLAEDELWAELEREEIPSHIREARLSALKQQSEQLHKLKDLSFGDYTVLPDEKSFLDLTTNTAVEHCVVHFFHSDFRRCSILDLHLGKLCKKYFETKFAKLDVERSHFLVARLKIQMLPAIFCFRKGVVIDKVIGFGELGNSDDFPTMVLERRLAKSGVIELSENEDPSKKSIFGGVRSAVRQSQEDSSDEDD